MKKKRQNNTLDAFSTSFVRGVLENPIYAGKLAYGRRKTEKIPGTRNQYHIVEQKEFPVYDGAHEGIISEELWQQAQKKRQDNSRFWDKVYHPERENLMSGLLRFPVCGAGMYGNVNRKRKKDSGFYKEYYYYACKHRLEVDGHRCDYNRQWKQEKVDAAVTEVIRKLVRNPKFESAIREKIGARIDTQELETELENLRKRHRQVTRAKKKLGQQMDKLDITDPFYDRKYQDMDERLCRLYEKLAAVERNMDELQTRLDNIRQQKISGDNIYQFLLYFDLLYDKFTDSEKKEFLQSFVERVDLFPEEQPGGRFLKRIKFRFPVFFEGAEVEDMRWDSEITVESVVTLCRE